jgi:hypothetical protein
MFKGWENFYLLIGGASGSLIGLLFIVATLFSGRDRERMLQGAAVYSTPTVFKLGVILVLSAAAMAPREGVELAGALLAGASLAGLIYSVAGLVRFRRLTFEEAPHWTDLWFYCLAPLILYLAMGVCAVLVWTDRSLAAPAVALVLMLMLLAAIRNAWDLVTWLSPGQPPPDVGG